jgi:hypothetical protein
VTAPLTEEELEAELATDTDAEKAAVEELAKETTEGDEASGDKPSESGADATTQEE